MSPPLGNGDVCPLLYYLHSIAYILELHAARMYYRYYGTTDANHSNRSRPSYALTSVPKTNSFCYIQPPSHRLASSPIKAIRGYFELRQGEQERILLFTLEQLKGDHQWVESANSISAPYFSPRQKGCPQFQMQKQEGSINEGVSGKHGKSITPLVHFR